MGYTGSGIIHRGIYWFRNNTPWDILVSEYNTPWDILVSEYNTPWDILVSEYNTPWDILVSEFHFFENCILLLIYSRFFIAFPNNKFPDKILTHTKEFMYLIFRS